MTSDLTSDPTWTVVDGVSCRLILDRLCRVEKVGAYFLAVVGGRLGSGLVEARVTCSTRQAAEAWCEEIAAQDGENSAPGESA